MAQSVTSRGHAWGELNGKGAENWGNGDQNISPAIKINQAGLDVRFPKTRGNSGEMKEEMWTCAELLEN